HDALPISVTKDRTTLLIAHRRSSLALADRIAVLDAGRVVDVGTEAELRERCALFRELIAGPEDDIEHPTAMPAVSGNGAGVSGRLGPRSRQGEHRRPAAARRLSAAARPTATQDGRRPATAQHPPALP